MKKEWMEALEAARRSQAGPGLVAPQTLARLSGLELLRGMLRGEHPYPPIAQALDFALIEVAEGRAVFQGSPRRDYLNPLGSVHGGYTATLLDSCMACAVHTTLAAGIGYTTVEIKINYVRPLLEATGPVRAEGRIIQPGRRIATAEGRLVDAAGKLYAHGTTTCLVFPLGEGQ